MLVTKVCVSVVFALILAFSVDADTPSCPFNGILSNLESSFLPLCSEVDRSLPVDAYSNIDDVCSLLPPLRAPLKTAQSSLGPVFQAMIPKYGALLDSMLPYVEAYNNATDPTEKATINHNFLVVRNSTKKLLASISDAINSTGSFIPPVRESSSSILSHVIGQIVYCDAKNQSYSTDLNVLKSLEGNLALCQQHGFDCSRIEASVANLTAIIHDLTPVIDFCDYISPQLNASDSSSQVLPLSSHELYLKIGVLHDGVDHDVESFDQVGNLESILTRVTLNILKESFDSYYKNYMQTVIDRFDDILGC